MDFSDAAALAGMIFGSAGLALSIATLLRDRPRISVTLQWDMRPAGDGPYDPKKLWGYISVTNTGRRTAYVSHIHLTTFPRWARMLPGIVRTPLSRFLRKRVPSRFGGRHLALVDGVAGRSLPEGGLPYPVMASQENLGEYSPVWRRLRAVAIDNRGRHYYSRTLPRGDVPSWAK